MPPSTRFSLPLAVALALTAPRLLAETAAPPPGTATMSWLGNSFMEIAGDQWRMVPEYGSDIAVSANGTVFTSGYHETHGGAASFRADTGAFAGRYSGFNSGFGDPSSSVAADDTYAYFGTSDGLRRCRHGGGQPESPWALNAATPKHSILGLALKDGKLYVSDYSYNRIRVLEAATMTELRSWEMEKPTKLAVDRDGRIWVIQEAPGGLQPADEGPMYKTGAIRSFSGDGTPGPSITDFDNPLALEVNPVDHQLYVGGLNRHAQIWRYDLSGAPRKVGAFGALDGIFSGTAGEFTRSAKLHWIRGIDFDPAGNVYVSCCYGTFWGHSVEKFSPTGELAWRVFCATSLDMGGVDPGDEQDVYTKFHHYRMNWGATNPGGEWSLKGFTVNRFKYPDDPRADSQTDVVNRSIGYGAVRIQGRRFMIRSDQGGYRFEMYRFNPATDGEVAIPSVVMGAGSEHTIKRDADGDGRFAPEETVPGYGDYNQYWAVAANGDIYTVADDLRYGTVVRYPFQGFDAVGNPIYTGASAQAVVIPAVFRDTHQARRLVYDQAGDRLYLVGSAIAAADDANTRLACFADWSTAARRQVWSVDLPYNDAEYTGMGSYGGGTAISIRQAGDHVFIAYGVGHVRILRASDGGLVGTLTQDLNGWTGGDGQIDAVNGLSVHRRASGEYILLIENAGWGHIGMYRWKPPGTTADPVVPPEVPGGPGGPGAGDGAGGSSGARGDAGGGRGCGLGNGFTVLLTAVALAVAVGRRAG